MVLDCPRCNARVGFKFGCELPNKPTLEDPIWNTLFVCRICQIGVVVRLRGPVGAKPSACQGDPCDKGFKVLTVHPKPQPLNIPDHLPEEIAHDYQEAADNLRRQAFTSAGMMCRKALQRATTALAPEGVDFHGVRLHQRIGQLAGRHLITPAMGDWAHLIRLEGNVATHDEEKPFDQAEADQIQAFTELFLIYAFTLPERVRRARGTDADQDA